MNLKSRKIISLALVFFMMLTILPMAPVTAHAAAGDGESDPLYVTTFAELKTALEKPADTYIVVNSFATSNTDTNGNKYYNLNDDYTVAGASAISIPAGYTKTLVVNTTIDCRASHLERHLSCFISNAGNLTIMGNGTINCGFNTAKRDLEHLTKNSVVYNTGTLTVKENPTLTTLNSDVTCARLAIWNAGNATIEGGTFIGCCDIPNVTQGTQVIDDCYAVLNDGTMTIKGGTFEAYTIRTGKTAHGLYSVNTNLSIYDGVFNGIESNTTMAREETDEPISSFLVSGYEYRKMTDDTVFDGSSISETGESLYVAPTGSVKHSITVSDGSASHTKAFAGTTVTLTAEVAEGMVFDKWEVISGNVIIEDNKFVMPNADVEIRALYKEKTVTITGTASPAEGGTITGSGEYTVSQQVTLTAIPNDGYKFVRWEENGIRVGDLPEYWFDVTSSTTNRKLVAVFEVDSTVPQPTEPTKIESANAQVTVPVAGENPNFTATPSDSDKYTTSVGVWYDYTSRKELTEGDTFVAGHKYDLRVVFTAKAGYTFDNNTAFTINGNSTGSYSTAYGYREIRFEVPEEGGETPVCNHENLPLVEKEKAIHTQEELKNGMEAHYYCADCEKYFDTDKNETTKDALTIEAKHTAGTAVKENEVTATCKKAGSYDEVVKCSECGKELSRNTVTGTTDATNHEGTAKWTKTAETHAKAYDCCEAVVVAEEPHEYDNNQDTTCDECGYERTIATVTCIIKFNSDGGSEVEPSVQNINLGGLVNKPADPTKEGFTFKGWFLGETEYDFAKPVVEGFTLTAKWEAKEVVPPCEHEYDNACDATCNKCDDVREVAGHTGGTATCQAPATCTVCEQPYGEKDENNHIYAAEWTTDRSNHWHKATCGHDVITAKEAHSYGGDRVCDICNYKKPSSGGSYGGGSYVAPDKDADSKLRIVMQINNKNILVNGVTKVNDVAPVIVGDRTLVPIRVVTELLGGSADWDNATRTVTLKIDGKTMNMTIGKEIPGFGTSAVIMNDRTYVPVRYVMEKLGAEVEWINATRQIIIEK